MHTKNEKFAAKLQLFFNITKQNERKKQKKVAF